MPRPKLFVNKTDDRISLASRSRKDSKWAQQKAESETIVNLYRGTEYDRYAQRMTQCCGLLTFNVTVTGKLKLESCRFCKVSTCPLCMARKTLLRLVRIKNALPSIISEFPTHRFLFATFTVKNVPADELGDAITALNKGYERLSKLKAFPARVSKDSPLNAGALKSLEFTRAKNDYCHPHVHTLLMVPKDYFRGSKYWSHQVWTDKWQKAMRLDYKPQVHVKAIKANNKLVKEHRQKSPLLYAVEECVKYSCKGSSLAGFGHEDKDREWLLEITKQMHRRKTLTMSGIFKKYIADVNEDREDLIHIDDEALTGEVLTDEQLYFKWFRREQNYFQVNN